VSRLKAAYKGKEVIGYGGRRFRVRFEEPVRRALTPGANDSSAAHGEIRIVHWQVQADAEMKYQLTCKVRHEKGKWRLESVALCYLGLKDKDGFHTTDDYKDMPVLTNYSKYNVYKRPVEDAFRRAFGGSIGATPKEETP